jgi:hypothetical protein
VDRSTERLLKTFQDLKDNCKAILGNFFGQEAGDLTSTASAELF